MKVDVTQAESFTVYFREPNFRDGLDRDSFLPVIYRCSPDEARALADHLDLYMVATLAAPFLSDEESDRHEPTIDSPYETISLEQTIPIRAVEYLFVDRRDSRVLSRIGPWKGDPDRSLVRLARARSTRSYEYVSHRIHKRGDSLHAVLEIKVSGERYQLKLVWDGTLWRLDGGP
ncbi:MAG: hypothetical protein ACI89L_000448 [Phycisphaerales bacterium]